MAADVTLPPGFTLDPDPTAGPALPPGFTPDPGHPVAGPSGNWWLDQARNLGSAAIDAGTALVAPFAGLKGAYGVDYSNTPMFGGTGSPTLTRSATPALPQARDNAYNAVGLTEYLPQTEAGKLARSGLTAAAGTAMTGNPAAAIPAFGGGVTSELLAQAAPTDPRAQTLARVLGFFPGAWATKTAVNLPFQPSSPAQPQTSVRQTVGLPASTMPPEDAALAQRAQELGINVGPGQLSRSPFVRFTASQLRKTPFSGVSGDTETQQDAFYKAVSNTFGEDATRITPEVLAAARKRLGAGYDDIATRTSIPVSNPMLTDLQTVIDDARTTTSADNIEPIQRQVDNIINTAGNNNGVISGTQFKALTAKGGPLDTMQGSRDSGIANAGNRIEAVLHDHLRQNATPDDVAALSDLDRQYKAFKTVQPLTLRADTPGGPSPSTGEISPAALRGAVNRSYGDNVALAPLGQVPLNDLAKIGQRFLKEPPDSGTAQREQVNTLMHGAGKIGAMMGGAALGHEAGIPLEYSVPMAVASPLAAALVGRAAGIPLRGDTMTGQLYANRLIGQALAQPGGFNFTSPGGVPPALLARALAQLHQPQALPGPSISSTNSTP